MIEFHAYPLMEKRSAQEQQRLGWVSAADAELFGGGVARRAPDATPPVSARAVLLASRDHWSGYGYLVRWERHVRLYLPRQVLDGAAAVREATT